MQASSEQQRESMAGLVCNFLMKELYQIKSCKIYMHVMEALNFWNNNSYTNKELKIKPS